MKNISVLSIICKLYMVRVPILGTPHPPKLLAPFSDLMDPLMPREPPCPKGLLIPLNPTYSSGTHLSHMTFPFYLVSPFSIGPTLSQGMDLSLEILYPSGPNLFLEILLISCDHAYSSGSHLSYKNPPHSS